MAIGLQGGIDFAYNDAMRTKSIIVEYDPFWAEEGLIWAHAVRDSLKPLDADVDHIGSTAVPGMAAKDVIDLQALVIDLGEPAITQALTQRGWIARIDVVADMPHPDFPGHGSQAWAKRYFTDGPGMRRLHLHVRRMGAANATLALMQRDFLRADASVRADWGRLKRALADHTHDHKVYAALKEPATTLLLRLAQQWAERTRWRPGASDAPAGEE